MLDTQRNICQKNLYDLPAEVMIEAEPRCNFSCRFCFNHASFARADRNVKRLNTVYVKKIIDNIAESDIKIVRFTGGEPMLRPDIFELMEHAKAKKLEVRLNTNGSLINEHNIERLKGGLDNVLIPIEGYNKQGEARITGDQDALRKKIRAVLLLKRAGIPVVRIGTVATKENIVNLDKLAQLILKLPIDEWEMYRPISINADSQPITGKDVDTLVNKIIKLRKSSDKLISIANAIPFCAIDNPERPDKVSCGALYDDGHSRLVVDPRGYVKPHYFMDENVGGPLNILGAWSHSFMRKMRNLKFLPKECRECKYKFKCRGGSRYEAKLATGDYSALDPLARPENINL